MGKGSSPINHIGKTDIHMPKNNMEEKEEEKEEITKTKENGGSRNIRHT